MKTLKNKRSKSSSIKKVISFLIVTVTLILAYLLNVYTGSFTEANKKLIWLFIYSLIGFISFFVVYYIAYFITLTVYNAKSKKKAKEIISCDDYIADLLSDGNYRFNYDKSIAFSKNVGVYKDEVLSVIKKIASDYGLDKSEYYYVNFTVYDAVKIISDAVDGIDVKISPIFKLLRAEDTPIKIAEKLLISALENDAKEESEKVEKPQNPLLKKIVDTAKKVGVAIVKSPLENALNDLTVFISYEAFKVYSKNGKQSLPSVKKEG